MDTSIAIAVIAAVLFVFIVPAALRRGAEQTEGEQQTVTRERRAEAPRSSVCTEDRTRPLLLADRAHPAAVGLPQPNVEYVRSAPQLSLRRPEPQLELVGEANSACQPAPAESPLRDEAPAALPLPVPLPVAVGQTTVLTAETAVAEHRGTSSPGGRPALTVVNSTSSPPMDPAMNPSPRTAPRRIASASERMPRALPADVRARLDRSYAAEARAAERTGRPGAAQGSGGDAAAAQRSGAQQDAGQRRSAQTSQRHAETSAADRRRIRGLRRVLPYCGLGFLVSAAATVIALGFALFASLPWAVPVVAAALATACLFLIRSLNTEVRALRAGLEPELGSSLTERAREAAHRTRDAARGAAGRAAQQLSDQVRAPRERTVLQFREEAGSSAEDSAREDAAAPQSEADAGIGTGASATAENPAEAAAGPQDAPVGQDEAQQGTAAEQAGPDAQEHASSENPGEHVAAAVKAAFTGATPAVSTAPSTAPSIVERSASAPSLSLGFAASAATAAPSGSADAETVFAATEAPAPHQGATDGSASSPAPSVRDAVARRLASGTWTPSALPVPSYVDAPAAEPARVAPVVADAASYSLAPADPASLAEQFADELGLDHPEASGAGDQGTGSQGADVATSTLAHGRTATRPRPDAAARVAAAQEAAAEEDAANLGDILARRRA